MKIHLTAICGTGMGSFAGILKQAGHDVRGSDENIYPPMSEMLSAWNIPVFQGFRPENLDWDPDLVIIGNVIKRSNPEAQAVLERGLPYRSFPAAMGEMFLEGRHSIVIAGTHGKTTTSSLTAWLLSDSEKAPGFLIGGVSKNFPQSFRDTPLGHAFVIEGDEYDTAFFDKGPKFLHYRPKTAVITSIEFDHADIYADADAVALSFRKLAQIMPGDGLLLLAKGAPGQNYLQEIAETAPCRVQWYGVETEADFSAEILEENAAGVRFRIRQHGNEIGEFFSSIPGRYNVANATSAIAIGLSQGCTVAQLQHALPRFEGVRRRQEERGNEGGVLVVDDFAHHPTAVRETLQALQTKYQGRRLWAVFEPRSATCRRNVLEPAYVPAFDLAAEVIVAHAHRSEEFSEEERFQPERLVRNIASRGVSARYVPEIDDIVKIVATEAQAGDVVVVMSNGGFGGIHGKLLTALRGRHHG